MLFVRGFFPLANGHVGSEGGMITHETPLLNTS